MYEEHIGDRAIQICDRRVKQSKALSTGDEDWVDGLGRASPGLFNRGIAGGNGVMSPCDVSPQLSCDLICAELGCVVTASRGTIMACVWLLNLS